MSDCERHSLINNKFANTAILPSYNYLNAYKLSFFLIFKISHLLRLTNKRNLTYVQTIHSNIVLKSFERKFIYYEKPNSHFFSIEIGR